MTAQEFSMFVMALRTYYPREQILPNNQAMELWYRQLQDIPYNIAEATLNKWVATNKWSPSIADIREGAVSIKTEKPKEWGDGWEQVLQAIKRYGMYQVEEAMASFDEITKQCVKRMGFVNICLSENITADRANFRMIYEQIAERKKSEAQLPVNLLENIAQIRLATKLEEAEKIGCNAIESRF
jgi:hypothetical protein